MTVKPGLYKDEVRLLTAFTEMNALRHCMSVAFTVDISMCPLVTYCCGLSEVPPRLGHTVDISFLLHGEGK